MKKSEGIILRQYTGKKQKIAVFDRTFGRVEAQIMGSKHAPIERLINGAHIHYTYQEKYGNFILDHIDILAAPFALARTDILFVHHMLELAYHFLPVNSACDQVYELIHVLLEQSQLSYIQKKLSLCKFFALIGLYPEDIPFDEQQFYRLQHDSSKKTLFEEKLDETMFNVVQSWLLRCLDLHPQRHRFKTKWNYEKSGI